MKFRKKPVVVDAEQFIPFEEDGKLVSNVSSVVWDVESETSWSINTLEGRALNVTTFDWIITGVNGEKYPCKPDVFKKTYETPKSS